MQKKIVTLRKRKNNKWVNQLWGSEDIFSILRVWSLVEKYVPHIAEGTNKDVVTKYA